MDSFDKFIILGVCVVFISIGTFVLVVPEKMSTTITIDGSQYLVNYTIGPLIHGNNCYVTSYTVYTSEDGNLSEKNVYMNGTDLRLFESNSGYSNCSYKVK